MSLRASTALALAGLALAVPAAGAENGWRAELIRQSEYPTLESGETVTSWFDARNIGEKTWEPQLVHLGTGSPRDRASDFYVAGSWVRPDRAVAIDSTVPPGASGRFTFQMRGPAVQATRTYREAFEPVVDEPSAGPGWMEWGYVWLDYTVIPAANPSVKLNSAPESVTRGDPIDLVATASDNRAIGAVTFSVRGRPGSVPGRRAEAGRYTGRIESGALPAGTHTIVVRAHDRAGHSATASTTVVVREPAGQPADPSPGPGPSPSPGPGPGPDPGPDPDPPVDPDPPPGPNGDDEAKKQPAWTVRLRTWWSYVGRRTRLHTLTVSRLKRDAVITLRCRGRGCRFKRRRVSTRRRSLVRLAPHFKRRLRAGDVVTLKVARPKRGARTYTYRIRAGKLPRAKATCTAPGGRRVRCAP